MQENERARNAVALRPLADEPALWDAARRGDLAARDRLIEAYLPFTRILAAKLFAGRGDNDHDFTEYLQFATVGMIEAIDHFDPERNASFKTFAGYRINGAVLAGMEHLSEKREQISARRRLLAERRDSGKAVLDLPETDLFQRLADVAIGLALGYLVEDSGGGHDHESINLSDSHYAGMELRQMQEKVRSLVDGLPQRERMVIRYHYLNHLPFTVIAETMGLTKSRISQLHLRALGLLRDAIKSVKACDVAW